MTMSTFGAVAGQPIGRDAPANQQRLIGQAELVLDHAREICHALVAIRGRLVGQPPTTATAEAQQVPVGLNNVLIEQLRFTEIALRLIKEIDDFL